MSRSLTDVSRLIRDMKLVRRFLMYTRRARHADRAETPKAAENFHKT